MKVLFLNPLIIYERWPILADYKRLSVRAIGVAFAQLAALIEEEECKIFDAFNEKIKLKDYIKMLGQYDVIAMSMVPPHLVLNMEITVRLIKIVADNAKIILGGHHATAFAEEWIEKGADIVVRHEGEQTFKEVIDALKNNRDLSEVKGIVFRNNGKIVSTSDRELIECLDDLPMPRWDLINFESSRGTFGNNNMAALIETSRGCIGGCNFCWVNWMWKRKQRYKSTERVMEELRRLYGFGVRTIIFADDNFGSNYKRDINIFKQIIDSEMKLDIWMFCRVDTIVNHPELIESAGRAGVKEVYVGFEALDINKVNDCGKNLKNIQGIDDYKKAYDILKKHRILVVGCFVQDLIGEKRADSSAGLRYSDICDMAQHAQIIPLKDSLSYQNLWHTRLLGIDPFYAGILSGYELNNQGRILTGLQNIFGLFNRNLIRIIFSNKADCLWAKKRIFNIYLCISKNIFQISFKKIIIFLYCFNPLISVVKKQNMLLRQYLSDRFLSDLAKLKK